MVIYRNRCPSIEGLEIAHRFTLHPAQPCIDAFGGKLKYLKVDGIFRSRDVWEKIGATLEVLSVKAWEDGEIELIEKFFVQLKSINLGVRKWRGSILSFLPHMESNLNTQICPNEKTKVWNHSYWHARMLASNSVKLRSTAPCS